ncbi:2,3-bisphosphoglycerate-independent phosphoglycerate mutase [Proteocatella sphenisci]|uniref:2,3-bisphosphoglycerate-independent phosphoglycerate mutase n=1 Tax=Proteocatella sphenisci TaxID=181070 RepID=UPI0004BB50C8|nr:2,3-bisphosphoglycerate-independent phosphoglycerate mutase [Proteocatella sphenisci]
MKKPIALIILDGFALIENVDGNAVKYAKKPNFDKLYSKYPVTSLGASGFDVGLPDGQMGNSEVGHLNIGAGRIVYQELTRISKAIQDGDFYENAELAEAMKNAREGRALHLMGLASDGGVHSHIEHLKGLVEMAKRHGVKEVYVHCFMDGRDTPPQSGLGFIKELEKFMSDNKTGKIATISGRYYAMDRDNRWERIEKSYDAVVRAKAPHADSPVKAMESSYENQITDEFINPVIVLDDYKGLKNGDSVIFFNFRPDRARELTNAITEDEFDGFERDKVETLYTTMTQYDVRFANVSVAYKPQTLTNTLGEYLSKKGMTQLRIAETEKYAHVTFFFNGGREAVYENESRILVDSPKVATYDLKPEMSAYEVTEKLLEDLENNPKDVIILNFANCDMVGHTGIFEAAVKAVETVDECLGKIVSKIQELGGAVLITADHGNAEKMSEKDGSPFTAHTTNRVPLIYVNNDDIDAKLREDGRLCDLSPTILDILRLDKPEEMTGISLIIK